MTRYRPYLMSERSAHIERFGMIDAACDSKAIEIAGAHSRISSLALYNRGQNVHRFSSTVTTSYELKTVRLTHSR
jgi:hypothetical protein